MVCVDAEARRHQRALYSRLQEEEAEGGCGPDRGRSQPKKTEPADIKPAPTQALCRHDRAYFLISEWTESLGFAEGLHSSGHALAQKEPRSCGSLWGLQLPAAPAHFTPECAWGWSLPGSAREKERQQVICRSLGGSDYGDEEFTSSRHCRTGGASETP